MRAPAGKEGGTRKSSPDGSRQPGSVAAPGHPILDLQRTLGNHAVQRLLASGRTSPAPQPQPTPGAGDMKTQFAEATSGPARELPYRGEMERAFGQSFDGVQAHLGDPAAERGLAALGAAGATMGSTVAFRTPNPSKELVAHELTHVQQNRQGFETAGSAELEARTVGAGIAAGGVAGRTGFARPAAPVQRSGETAANVSKILALLEVAYKEMDDAKVDEVAAALQSAPPAQDPNATTSDVMFNLGSTLMQLRLTREDVSMLKTRVAEVRTALHPAMAQAPPANKPAPAPAPKPPSAAQNRALADTMTLQQKILDAGKAQDDKALEAIRNALLAAESLTAASEATKGVSIVGSIAVVVGGATYCIDRAEIQGLAAQADQAAKPVPLGPIAQKIPSAIDLNKVGFSFMIPAGKLGGGNSRGDTKIYSNASTQVSLSVTPTGLSLQCNPSLQVWNSLAKNVLVSGISLDFATGKVTVSCSNETNIPGYDMSDQVREFLSGQFSAAIAGSALAKPGYNPLNDPDLPATLKKIAANVGGGSGGSSAPGPLQAVSNIAANATFTLKTPFSHGEGGNGISIAAGSSFMVVVAGSPGGAPAAAPGAAASPGGAAAPAATTPPKVDRVTLSGSLITVLSSGQPVATFDTVEVTPGGAVSVRNIKLAGSAKTAADLEAMFRILGAAAELSSQGVPDEPALALGIAQAGTRGKITIGVTKSMIEQGLTAAVRKLILENAQAIPQVNLAEALGMTTK